MKGLKSLLLFFVLFSLVGNVFVNAYTLIEDNKEFGKIIITDAKEEGIFQLFGIVSVTPSVAKPGQTVTLAVGIENPRLASDSKTLIISVGSKTKLIWAKQITPYTPPCSFCTIPLSFSFQIPQDFLGEYLVTYELRSILGTIIDTDVQTFKVEPQVTSCPSTSFGPYFDFASTSDGNGVIQISKRNLYSPSPECKFLGSESQSLTVCYIGHYISGQPYEITTLKGEYICKPLPGAPALNRCGNGILDTGEYCDPNLPEKIGECSRCRSDCMDSEPIPGCSPPPPPDQTGLCTKKIGQACEIPDGDSWLNWFGIGDHSGPSSECETGWCADTTGPEGQCAKVGLKGDLSSKVPGAEPHPSCKQDTPPFDLKDPKVLIIGGLLIIGGFYYLGRKK